ncbi:MAG: hypothetical protein JST54_27755 [Deltaproteobacteria bacterium]|nr:hypothetical protein [Deltaproteobacteria bacterium]
MNRTLALAALCLFAFGCHRERAPTEAELQAKRDALEAEKEQLQAELHERTQAFMQEAESLDEVHGVVMAVPSTFVAETIRRVITDGLNDSALRLEDVKVGVSNDISADLGLVRVTLGDFVIDANLLEVNARIRTQEPKVSISRHRFEVSAPVETSRGTGRVHLRFRWSGRGLAQPICGDIDVARDVEGAAAPLSTVLTASATLAVEHGEFVVIPNVPRPRLRLYLEPSPAAWETVKSAIGNQSDLCRTVLAKIDVLKVLRNLLDKGIVVTLPSDELKPFRIPIALTQEIQVQDRSLTMIARPERLSLGTPHTWFAASVEFRRGGVSSE